MISMDGWRLERACQWYLYSGISSLMGTAVLGSVDLCMGQCIRESSKGGWANSGSPVHSVGRAVLVLPSPRPSRRDGATSGCMPLNTPSSTPSVQAAFSHTGPSRRLGRPTATRRLHILYKQLICATERLPPKEIKYTEKFCLKA